MVQSDCFHASGAFSVISKWRPSLSRAIKPVFDACLGGGGGGAISSTDAAKCQTRVLIETEPRPPSTPWRPNLRLNLERPGAAAPWLRINRLRLCRQQLKPHNCACPSVCPSVPTPPAKKHVSLRLNVPPPLPDSERRRRGAEEETTPEPSLTPTETARDDTHANKQVLDRH